MATLLAPSRPDRAFERLYRRHVADVYRYVLAVLQNEADAEDATQTAFLCAYRAYERGERPERAQNWLIAIAHNVCRQRFRESARRPRLVELDEEVTAGPQADEAPNADEIRRALGFLAFNQRAALVLRELQGRSYDEIAIMLGLSVSAVETLLFRARRALREQLEGALTCAEAERALSKRADRRLSFAERGQLRAHLRECAECAALERGQRFRSRALRGLGLVPVPSSLSSFFGGGAAGTGVSLAAKAGAVVAAGMLGAGLAGDAIRSGPAEQERPAGTESRAGAATAQPQEASVRHGRVASRLSFTRTAPPRRLPSAREGGSVSLGETSGPTRPEADPSLPAPSAESPQAAAEPAPVQAARGAVPTVPTVPSLPVPPPAPVAPPPVPEVPQVTAPPPELPALPALPSLPRIDLPPVELPQTTRIEVPATSTLVQP